MALLTNLLFFIIASTVLAVSAFALTKSLIRIAAFLKLSEFTAAFIIMALSTSLPELFVGITSAINKNPALSLGNVIGANISDLTLVLGFAVIVAKGIKVNRKSIRKDSFFMFLIAILPIILMILGKGISRLDGVILISVFLLYSWNLIKERKYFHAKLENKVGRLEIIIYSMIFIISLVALFFSANQIVKSGLVLATDLKLPLILVGIFLIALATTLPELVFGIISARKGHPDFALGNSIGSVVVNSTFVIGIVALIQPITANFLFFMTSSLFMIIACLLFITFIESGNEIDFKEGLTMISLYVFFIIIELTIKGYFGNFV